MGLDVARVVSPAALYPAASGEDWTQPADWSRRRSVVLLLSGPIPATWKRDGPAYSAFNPDTIGGGD
jgi:hypothetical protein